MKYVVKITKVEEDGAEEVLHEENHKNVIMLAEDMDSKKVTEIIMNDNIMGIAAKIGSSQKVRDAAKLFMCIDGILKDHAEDSENGLLARLIGGLQ